MDTPTTDARRPPIPGSMATLIGANEARAKRDAMAFEFAKILVAGMVSRPAYDMNAPYPNDMAKLSFELADAMIEAGK